jgi:hypothetical protein
VRKYLLWRNYYYKKKIIYSNYTLFGIPYFKITTVSQLDKIRNGYVGADEMWIWIQSVGGERLKKKIVEDILRRSRKRKLTYAYTSQTLEQVHPHIKKINDFIAYPILNATNSVCKLLIFAGPRGKTLLRTHYFYTKPIFSMYNTNEEVSDLIDDVTPRGKKQLESGKLDKTVKPIAPMLTPYGGNPIIPMPVKKENVSLDDAMKGAVGTEDIDKKIESSESMSEKLRKEKRELMKKLKSVEKKLKKEEEKEVEEEVEEEEEEELEEPEPEKESEDSTEEY